MSVRYLCNFNDVKHKQRGIYLDFGPISNSIMLKKHSNKGKIECQMVHFITYNFYIRVITR